MLIILGGLPGVGKSTIARRLARRVGAMHVRIDAIEHQLCSVFSDWPIHDVGYRVAYAVAEDNLRLGHTVIADSVNPVQITREAWIAVAHRARVGFLEVEITCSDESEHRRRVETRTSDIPEFVLPTWTAVVAREYHPWVPEHLLIDSARLTVEESVDLIRAALHH